MARTSKRPRIQLTAEQRDELEKMANSRKAPRREVERANVILCQAAGENISSIERRLRVSRPTIYKCIERPWPPGRNAA